MLQYDDTQMADFRGYDLVHHDDLSYVASAHAECKFIIVNTRLQQIIVMSLHNK